MGRKMRQLVQASHDQERHVRDVWAAYLAYYDSVLALL
jgi:hypothetical protein